MGLRALSLLLLILAGCSAAPPAVRQEAKPSLQFVDLQQFDQDLAVSLAAPLPRVEVSFYDRIAPSKLPPRVQEWMAAVEDGGGKVRVVPPPGSVTAKNPFLLISAVSALWQGQKVLREASAAAALRKAHAYDAELVLRQSEAGDVFVDRVVFLQRAR
jgi:hypothetical protein